MPSMMLPTNITKHFRQIKLIKMINSRNMSCRIEGGDQYFIMQDAFKKHQQVFYTQIKFSKGLTAVSGAGILGLPRLLTYGCDTR